MFSRSILSATIVAASFATCFQVSSSQAVEGRWQRVISYQDKRDLFANYYVGPQPSGTAAQMYVSPQPVPANVGHTYTTYQPLMPHEYLNKHTRTHYAHTPGAGWTRAKVRYRTFGLKWQDIRHDLNWRF